MSERATPHPIAALALLIPGVWSAAASPQPYDPGELVQAAVRLGGSHAPGQPLHALIAHALARALPVGSWSWRISIASVLFALGGAWIVGWIAGLAAQRGGADARTSRVAASATMAATMLAPPVLRSALRPEVYALALCLGAIGALGLSRWALWRDGRGLRVAALAAGLELAVHPPMGLALVAAGLVALLAKRREVLRSPRALGLAALACVAGMLALSYLPLRAAAGAPMWGDPTTWAGFVAYVSGAAYAGNLGTRGETSAGATGIALLVYALLACGVVPVLGMIAALVERGRAGVTRKGDSNDVTRKGDTEAGSSSGSGSESGSGSGSGSGSESESESESESGSGSESESGSASGSGSGSGWGSGSGAGAGAGAGPQAGSGSGSGDLSWGLVAGLGGAALLAALLQPHEERNPDNVAYAALGVALVIAAGAASLAVLARRSAPASLLGLAAIALQLPSIGALPETLRADLPQLETLAFALVEGVPPRALVITRTDFVAAAWLEAGDVDRARPDAALFIEGLSTSSWHWRSLAHHPAFDGRPHRHGEGDGYTPWVAGALHHALGRVDVLVEADEPTRGRGLISGAYLALPATPPRADAPIRDARSFAERTIELPISTLAWAPTGDHDAAAAIVRDVAVRRARRLLVRDRVGHALALFAAAAAPIDASVVRGASGHIRAAPIPVVRAPETFLVSDEDAVREAAVALVAIGDAPRALALLEQQGARGDDRALLQLAWIHARSGFVGPAEQALAAYLSSHPDRAAEIAPLRDELARAPR